MKDKKTEEVEDVLTEEEIAKGVKISVMTDEELKRAENKIESVDVSDAHVNRIAEGFILGNRAIGRRKNVRAELEKRVVDRIGKKGKYLTDKLFELIEGVHIVQKADEKGIRYYKVPPSLPAIQYALDRVLGKPSPAKKEDDEKKGIAVVEEMIKNLAGGGTVTTRKSIEIKE